MKRVIKTEHLRLATYSDRKVRLPNASAMAYGKLEASKGDIVTYAYPGQEETHLGRVLARVDAESEGPTVPAIKENIAVLELGSSGTSAFIRWIAPEWVRTCETFRGDLLAFFSRPELPALKSLAKLNSLGALSSEYISKYGDCCDRCIQAEGLFAPDRCTHRVNKKTA